MSTRLNASLFSSITSLNVSGVVTRLLSLSQTFGFCWQGHLIRIFVRNNDNNLDRTLYSLDYFISDKLYKCGMKPNSTNDDKKKIWETLSHIEPQRTCDFISVWYLPVIHTHEFTFYWHEHYVIMVLICNLYVVMAFLLPLIIACN